MQHSHAYRIEPLHMIKGKNALVKAEDFHNTNMKQILSSITH